MKIVTTTEELGEILRKHTIWIFGEVEDTLFWDNKKSELREKITIPKNYLEDAFVRLEGKEPIELLGLKTHPVIEEE